MITQRTSSNAERDEEQRPRQTDERHAENLSFQPAANGSSGERAVQPVQPVLARWRDVCLELVAGGLLLVVIAAALLDVVEVVAAARLAAIVVIVARLCVHSCHRCSGVWSLVQCCLQSSDTLNSFRTKAPLRVTAIVRVWGAEKLDTAKLDVKQTVQNSKIMLS